MNKMTTHVLLVFLMIGAGIARSEQVAVNQPAPVAATNDVLAPADMPAATVTVPATGQVAEAVQVPAAQTNAVAPRLMGGKGLRLNFRGAPLEMVLNYMSEAAGFTIVLETELKGKVDVWSNQLLDRDEAVNLLNSILNQNGYAAIRNGKTLTIVSRDDAKKRDIPVQSGNDPAQIRKTDEMVTQVIPIQYANATQLTKDLQPLLPAYATLTANESGNALVLTDTQSDVRRMVEIVNALDTSISSILTIRVFHLVNSDPVEMADMFTQLFPDDKSGNDMSNPFAGFRFGRFGGGFGGGGGGFDRGGGGPGNGAGGGTGAVSGGNNDRLKKKGKVVAVADQRTASIIVSAASELMPQIAEMIAQLDGDTAKKQKVYVYTLENADVQDIEPILDNMFQKSVTSNTRTTSNQSANPLNNRNPQVQGTLGGSGSSGGLGGAGSSPFSR